MALSVFAVLMCTGLAQAAFPGRNGRIAFTNTTQLDPHSEDSDIVLYSVDPKGRKLTRLANDGFSAAYSPDGRRIAYNPDDLGLLVIRADGRGRTRQLIRGLFGDSDPNWSPSGKRIVFVRGGELRIYENGRTHRLIENGVSPAWSVTGWIAFVRRDEQNPEESDIYVVRPDGGGLRKVVDGGNEPDWSPTGHRIVFSDTSGVVTTVRMDGTRVRQLRPGRYPAYSPDGHKIVYISQTREPRLMVMGSGGKHPRSVLNRVPTGRGIQFKFHPCWQPLPQ